jgi:hypothetical protein
MGGEGGGHRRVLAGRAAGRRGLFRSSWPLRRRGRLGGIARRRRPAVDCCRGPPLFLQLHTAPPPPAPLINLPSGTYHHHHHQSTNYDPPYIIKGLCR